MLRKLEEFTEEFVALLHRSRHGWAPRDTWSLDNYLASIISESVAELAKNKIGHPVSEILCGDHVNDWTATHDGCMERWHKFLEEISEGFAIYNDKEDCAEQGCVYGNTWWTEGGCKDHLKTKYERAWELLKEFFPALWD